jgi:hypothetical protein
MMFINKINPVVFYRLVRIAFALLFTGVGMFYKDGWPAYIFAAIFLITALMKPRGCVGESCSFDNQDEQPASGKE